MGLWMLLWILLILSQMLEFVDGGISVQFKTGGPLYVALGESLVLEAVFMKNPEDKIDIVTWDRERGTVNVRISDNPNSDRISLEKDKALLRIKNLILEDFGTYKVTVTDNNGLQTQASIEVRKMDDPPKASMVLECDVDTSGVIQWDFPEFSWFVDGVPVTNQTALLSNGSKLDISQVSGYNYTCVITSSLGTSVASYQTSKPTEESKACSCHSGLISVGILLALILCVAGGIFIRNRCQTMPSPIPSAAD